VPDRGSLALSLVRPMTQQLRCLVRGEPHDGGGCFLLALPAA